MKTTPRRDRGFTLLEMMTVLAIALILMMMMVEVFKVSTHTVQIVERKLAVYEAARGLLDEVEDTVRRTGYNERGELFAIKSMSFTDNDPFTVNNPDPTAKYGRSSVRCADRLHFLFMRQGLGNSWRNYALIAGQTIAPPFAGSRNVPLSYDQWMGDLYEGVVGSNLQSCSTYSLNRPLLLNDVSKMECTLFVTARISRGNYDDEWPNFYEPGAEVDAPAPATRLTAQPALCQSRFTAPTRRPS